MSLQYLLEFIVVLVAIILLHEFGHFLACRLFKVEVEEFGVGLPPRAVTLFEAGGTKFTLNWLPFGGFTRPKGENDPSVPGGLAAANPWVRIAVFAAGPIMNLLAAVILYAVMLNQLGMPDPARPEVIQINAISKQSPAEQAGLQVGDILLSINSQPITNTVTAHDIIYANLGQPVTITYQRGQAIREVTVTPRTNPPQEGAVGISMGTPIVPVSLVTAIPEGVKATYRYSEMLVGLIGQLIRGKAPAEQGRLVGLKGMVDMYETVRSSEPPPAIPMLVEVLGFFTSITISLGLINLLPVPALDGGRILFALPEVVIHRRIPPKYENMVNGISFLILIALMILINLQDFINPARLP